MESFLERMRHITLHEVNFRFVRVYIISFPNVCFLNLALATRCDPNMVYSELLIPLAKSPAYGVNVGILLDTPTGVCNAGINELAWPVLDSWVAEGLVERLSVVISSE